MDDWGEPSRKHGMPENGEKRRVSPPSRHIYNIKARLTERGAPRQHSRRGRRRERRQVGLPGEIEQDVDVEATLGLAHQLTRRNAM
jgi:hypothetical protein